MRAGERLGTGGRFELIEPAGEGGEATVWRARDRKLRCDVAIKALHIDGSAALDNTARLHHELRVLLSVNDPHVVRVVDFGIDTDRGRYWYAMEWLDGRTVRQLVEDEGSLAWYDAALVARQVCLGLRTLHAQRIVHGDIKSSNVFIVGDSIDTGFVKLIDFGIAVQGRHILETVQATLVGVTERWAPPEALLGGHISRRSDVYQVGVLLYEMLTGQLPFGGQNIDEVIGSICKAPRPRPVAPSGGTEVPSDLAELCVQAMAIAREERPRSAAAFAEALGAVLAAHDRQPVRRSPHENGAATRVVDRKLGSNKATQRTGEGHRTDLRRGKPTLRRGGGSLRSEGVNAADDGVPSGRLSWLGRIVRPDRPDTAHARDTSALLPAQPRRTASGSVPRAGGSAQRAGTTRRVDGRVASGTSLGAHGGRQGRGNQVTRSGSTARPRDAMRQREKTSTSPRHTRRAKKRHGASFFVLLILGIGSFAFIVGAVWMAPTKRAGEAGGHRNGVSGPITGAAPPVTGIGTITAATTRGTSAPLQKARRGRWNMPFAFPGRDHLARSLAGARFVPLTRLWGANWLQVAQRLIPYGWKWVELQSSINLASKALVYQTSTPSNRASGPHPMAPTLEVRFDDTNRPWRLYLRFRSHLLDLTERAERAWGRPDGYLIDFDGMLCPLWHFRDAVVWVRKFTRRSGRLAGLTWTALVVADPARYERDTALRTQRFAHRN